MDPNECWNTIILYCEENHPEDAVPYIAALKGWPDQGGFEPQNFNTSLFASMCSWAGV